MSKEAPEIRHYFVDEAGDSDAMENLDVGEQS